MNEGLFRQEDGEFLRAVRELISCNPFGPDRIRLEREALGAEYRSGGRAWNEDPYRAVPEPNLRQIRERAGGLLEEARGRLARGGESRPGEEEGYRALLWYVLFHERLVEFDALIREGPTGAAEGPRAPFFDRFAERYAHYREVWADAAAWPEPAFVFAFFYQVRRAFLHIFSSIIGGAPVAGRLRARVWQSVFSRDLERYQRSLHARMGDVFTLITGPSGTGKELVARAVGWSRFVPFDPARRAFRENYARTYYPVNLAALSPTLVESELFGHRKGAYTGALYDHRGYFATCGAHGTVFLDEIAETSLAIQVKLLRVLQTRQFQRLGDTESSSFAGKLIAATNRDLGEALRRGEFREDLYYRLCADRLETPSLREVLREQPDELAFLVRHIARRVAGEAESEALTAETLSAISRNLGGDYAWPGNFRELEQCVRNVLVHGECTPNQARATPAVADELTRALSEANLTAEQVLRLYTTRAFARHGGNLAETARRLDLDRRTVRKYVEGRDGDGGGQPPDRAV